MARKRTVPLYCIVLSQGPQVIVKMPEDFVPWAVIRKEVCRFMQEDFKIPAKNVWKIEGIAGALDDAHEDRTFLARCHAVFAGETEGLLGFHLYSWQPLKSQFVLKRAAIPTLEQL